MTKTSELIQVNDFIEENDLYNKIDFLIDRNTLIGSAYEYYENGNYKMAAMVFKALLDYSADWFYFDADMEDKEDILPIYNEEYLFTVFNDALSELGFW